MDIISSILVPGLISIGRDIIQPSAPQPVSTDNNFSAHLENSLQLSEAGKVRTLLPNQWPEVLQHIQQLQDLHPTRIEYAEDGLFYLHCQDGTRHQIQLSDETMQQIHFNPYIEKGYSWNT